MKGPTKKTKHNQKETTPAQRQVATPVSRQTICQRAYEIWLARGCTHGYDVQDWLEAETDLLREELLMLDQ